jgi:hypothetical protein
VLDPSSDASSSRVKKSKPKQHRHQRKEITKNGTDQETWRIFGIDVDPDALGTSVNTRHVAEATNSNPSPERTYLTPPVLASLLSRLRINKDSLSDSNSIYNEECKVVLPSQLKDVRVVRRSIDARRRKGAPPKYSYVIDVTVSREVASHQLKLSHQPGRMERLAVKNDGSSATKEAILPTTANYGLESRSAKQKIIIIGAGPAGLFCALALASSGFFTPIVLERGKPVEARGKSIGALVHRRSLDPESNFSFGEGGAGTVFQCEITHAALVKVIVTKF